MIDRSAFLYMEGDGRNFAQCSRCTFWITQGQCYLHGAIKVPGTASCGLYVHGQPMKGGRPQGFVSTKESGLVDREVRCENCRWFHGGECGLYGELNRRAPAIFKLNTSVQAKACCNAQEPK